MITATTNYHPHYRLRYQLPPPPRPSYYLLGHVARFAPRGSVRLGVSFQVVNGSVGSGSSGAGGATDFVDVAGKRWLLFVFCCSC